MLISMKSNSVVLILSVSLVLVIASQSRTHELPVFTLPEIQTFAAYWCLPNIDDGFPPGSIFIKIVMPDGVRTPPSKTDIQLHFGLPESRWNLHDMTEKKTMYIKMKGLSLWITEAEIYSLFQSKSITPDMIGFYRDKSAAIVKFRNTDAVEVAMQMDGENLGGRNVNLFYFYEEGGARNSPSSKYPIRQHSGLSQRLWTAHGGTETESLIKMRGLPFSTTEAEIVAFLQRKSVTPIAIQLYDRNAQAVVKLQNPSDVEIAVTMNGELIGQRYVEVDYYPKDEEGIKAIRKNRRMRRIFGNTGFIDAGMVDIVV